MANEKRSFLKEVGIDNVIHVLRFVAPRFEGPFGRGRKLPGEITFILPHIHFITEGKKYQIFHNNETFNFEATSSTSDLKMNTTVTGLLY